VRIVTAAGDPTSPWPASSRPVSTLTAALTAIGAAAQAFAARLATPRASAPRLVSGIDYLGLPNATARTWPEACVW
jgi:hypothetical protein